MLYSEQLLPFYIILLQFLVTKKRRAHGSNSTRFFVNEKMIFYKTLFSKVADVHFSPNRKSSHHISEVFEILEEIAKVYDDVKTLYEKYDSQGFGSTPKDIPELVSKLSSKMENSRSKLSGFFVRLLGGSDVSNVRSIFMNHETLVF